MTGTPPLLAFTGSSGSGKTTLIEKLIPILSEAGYKVGAIKRSHHNVDIDREGKDSWRFSRAGANPTVLAGEGFIGYMERSEDEVKLSTLAEFFREKVDIVLIEGFKNEAVPAFFFGHPRQAGAENNIAGFIVPEKAVPEHAEGRPVFIRDDVRGVAEYIIQHINREE